MKPLSLSILPTPLEPLRRASARLGVEVWLKREDRNGAELAGNKVRKLEYLLADALQKGARTILTCGGIQSNHCRATAVACRRLGLEPVLLLRGEPPAEPDGNLLLDQLLGARIHWVDQDGYQERDAWLATLASEVERPYIIPEGGSNGLGALGWRQAGHELLYQMESQGLEFDTIVCAVGSGGTLAGLVLSGLPGRLCGMAVAPDANYFRRRIPWILTDAQRYGAQTPPHVLWELHDAFGRGYAQSRPEEVAEIRTLAREEGVILDPVYTGKAWYAMVERLQQQPDAFGKRILFWHTGGLYGWFGKGRALTAP